MTTVRRRRRLPAKRSEQQKTEAHRERVLNAARDIAKNSPNPQFGKFYMFATERALEGQFAFLEFQKGLKQWPVGIEEFLDSDEFMGSTDLKLWPAVRSAIIDIVEQPGHEWWRGEAYGAWTELLAGGATGTGKSELTKVLTAYSLHILGCIDNPQSYYEISSATWIIIPIFAAKPKVTKNVLYDPLRSYISQMPWFRKNMRFDKYIESEMVFLDHKIQIRPVGADVDSILGEAVIGSMMDEANFMQIVAQSKKAEAKLGRSARYDQAAQIYEKVTSRKRGRFGRIGPNLGWICTMSSTLYPGEFTDTVEESVRKGESPHIYVYRKKQYEAVPPSRFKGMDYFHVAIHDDAGGSVSVLDKNDPIPARATIHEVPMTYLPEFRRDPEGQVRDVIGVSTRSLSPFFGRSGAIEEAMCLYDELNLPSIVIKPNVNVAIDGMPSVIPGHYCKDPSRPRYVHIDLAHTGDRCGIAMLAYDGMAEMVRQGGAIELLPTGVIELAVSIEPDKQHGVDVADVRAWVHRLKRDYGYPIVRVSYDTWNSLESRQQWKKQGTPADQISVDKKETPYMNFREAIYDGRCALYRNELLAEELTQLEHHREKKKIDHLPGKYKDIADACCGAWSLMISRSDSWRMASGTGGRSDSGRFSGDRANLGQRR